MRLQAVILLFVFVFSSMSARAQSQLKYFVPGAYALAQGQIEDCGDGEFKIIQNGQNIQLGYLHGFYTDKRAQILPGDAPGDENCEYQFTSDVVVKATETVLQFSEKRKCGGRIVHTLSKTGHIENGKIRMDVVQQGSPALNYSCTWNLKP